MRILHVSESLPGGPASYIQDIVSDQIERFGAGSVALLIPAEQMSHLGPLVGLGGLRVVTYRRTGRDVGSLIRLALALRREMRRSRPDIVHLHSTFAGVVGRLVGRGRGSIIAYCAHCWSFARADAGWRTRVYAAIERWLAPRTDVVIDIAPHEVALRRRHGIDVRDAALVVTGIASLPAVPPEPWGGGRPLRLLYIGRTDRQKGFDLLMREIADIDPRRAVLTVVGTNVVDRRGVQIPPQVEVVGWVDRGEVHRIISAADAVVMPSRWEGMPILALEAFRAGRPLLASRIAPFDFLVRDGVDGLLMDIDARGFLARAVDRLEVGDPATMGAAARDAFETRFRVERMRSELIEAYRAALDRDCLSDSQRPRPATMAVQPGPSASNAGHVARETS